MIGSNGKMWRKQRHDTPFYLNLPYRIGLAGQVYAVMSGKMRPVWVKLSQNAAICANVRSFTSNHGAAPL
jgi:hypothetical protein